MKNLIVSFFVLLIATTVTAQDWQNDLNTAKELAASQDKNIILVFQGSDWCAPCIKLDREIWNTDTFKSYAKDHYVMLQADFPRKKKNALPVELQKKNNALAEKYNTRGIFPLVVLLNAEGTVLGETGYFKSNPQGYIQHLEELIR